MTLCRLSQNNAFARLASGGYALALTVYQSLDGVRLMLPEGVDHLVLKIITEN
jgi:hypothetical protein